MRAVRRLDDVCTGVAHRKPQPGHFFAILLVGVSRVLQCAMGGDSSDAPSPVLSGHLIFPAEEKDSETRIVFLLDISLLVFNCVPKLQSKL